MNDDIDIIIEDYDLSVPEDIEPIRVDVYLKNHEALRLSRSQIQWLITHRYILVNEKNTEKKYLIQPGDKISVSIPEQNKHALIAEDLQIEPIYEDDHMAIINKPAGMVTHPGSGNYTGTLVNGLLFRYGKLPGKEDNVRPGIIHRLDKDTTGLLVVARSDEAYLKLQEAMSNRDIKRQYLALICGHVKEESGTIDLPIGRSLRDRKKMAVQSSNSVNAITDYKLIDRFRLYDLLEITLQTGRTHQIRVHFSHLKTPVFGDPDYGGRDSWHRGIFAPERPLAKKLLSKISRQALHAQKLSFNHPITNKELKFEADLPDDFKMLLDLLNEEGR